MPRCKNINCKDKFKPKYFLQKHCMGKDECIKLEIQMKTKEKVKKEIKEMKINAYSKEYKGYLQDEINLLARKIDGLFGYGCIDDCGRTYAKQIDGAHYHSRGANCTLRYNLHNIHAATSHCNQYSDLHKTGYKVGLIKRYGEMYFDFVESLISKYKNISLSNKEIHDKLSLVRKINREFDTFILTDGKQARELFNKLIGIYK